jgi:hypothetical protein
VKSNRLRNRKIALILSIVFLVGWSCNLNKPSVNLPIDLTLENQVNAVPSQNITNPTTIATDPKPNESIIKPSDTPSDNQLQVEETTQPINSEIKVIGGWYGPACDEEEGTFIYRWSVDLMENATSGGFIGVAKFHDCPGGGRVSYYLTGDHQTGNIIFLIGDKTDSGGGDLFGSAEQTINFTFDLTTGEITPNLSP